MSKTTAEIIKELRKQRGMTLEDVAQKVGVGKSTVRKWETGMIENMGKDKIISLAKALNTSPKYLMGWEDEDIKDNISEIKQDLINKIINMDENSIEKLSKIIQAFQDIQEI